MRILFSFLKPEPKINKDEVNIEFDRRKIKCEKLEEFEINNMTGLPGIIGVNLSNTLPSNKSSDSPRPR